jgi:hypothetical protein
MSHLRWPQILSVALRLRVSEAVLRTGYPLESYRADESCRAVLEEFGRIAAGQIATAGRAYRTARQAKSEGPAVDAYLQRVGEVFRKQAAPARAGSPLAQTLFDAILTACGLTLCQTCSGTSACPWTRESGAADTARISSDGECIQPVHDLFRWSSQIAADAYIGAGVHSSFNLPELKTGHGERSSELELAIDGSTHQGVSSKAARSVRITFHPESFWIPDYLSLPYVLSHECVAHAGCGVDVEAPGAEKSKAFHDGWMDCVSAYVLKRGLLGAQRNSVIPIFAREIWEQTENVRVRRFNWSRSSASVDVSAWMTGRTALEALWRLFALAQHEKPDPQHWDKVSDAAQNSLIDLSLRINASQISHDHRARFVQSINYLYSRTTEESRANALARSPQVLDYISEYEDRQDERLLVRKIIALR